MFPVEGEGADFHLFAMETQESGSPGGAHCSKQLRVAP